MTRKVRILETAVVVLCIVIVLLIVVGAGYIYCSYHPVMTVSRASSTRFSGEGGHHEVMMLVYHEAYNVPIALSVKDTMSEYMSWNESVISELNTYTMPYDIRVSGEVDGGKTTLRYEGYVTTEDGDTVDYLNEMTFAFAFDLMI